MINKRVLFRFDANAEMGTGHAMRCFALIQALQKASVEVYVLAKELPSFFIEKLTKSGVTYLLLADKTIDSELTQIEKTIAVYQIDIVLLDGYHFDSAYRQQLSNFKVKLIAFDDTKSLEDLYCHGVINALPNAHQLMYQNSPYLEKAFLGLSFALLREEFHHIKVKPLAEKQKILVCFGGSDIGGLTFNVCQQLVAKLPKKIVEQIEVVVGQLAPNKSRLKALAQTHGFTYTEQCNNMAELLNDCYFAVAAPGSIVYELAYCRVPSVFFTVADNQIMSAQQHQLKGWCNVVNGLDDQQVRLGISMAIELLKNKAQLNKMYSATQGLVDLDGGQRIATEIIRW
ncbi:UDP-2,4-diacetamido-2,4,6-trideoxy-beta-L-altropyranose hydrolase [Thalassotalea marina]|uniref:UDP-2,4-diacetamido-2,4, 6-trideoxy-beta-L-altropyranose hydrolase n=1 Tax=Thalassotalea marina TaxID=1673741 RepID=A0A919BCZ1_9GAMM|nr:UDP-2,4-diacetamido-2,4,6-trideoxy-beta-L-altropyranose hydrolase [Thalassotalea marina]GHF80368.1 hypothetical protein GCM10017161_04550 [Thalassotalea marina]